MYKKIGRIKMLHYDDDGRAFFIFRTDRVYMDEITRVHHNPWIGGNFPKFIHGHMELVYPGKYYIELLGDSAVNVYERS